jgi:hypothetical protein
MLTKRNPFAATAPTREFIQSARHSVDNSCSYRQKYKVMLPHNDQVKKSASATESNRPKMNKVLQSAKKGITFPSSWNRDKVQ